MNEVLVIGGAGFVGSHLCHRLLSTGCKVTSLDNYFTGRRSNHHQGVRYVEGNSADILQLDLGPHYDCIFHLGEYSRVEQSFDDIDLVFEYNMRSIYSVLSFTKATGAKLVYSASSTKFGDGGVNPAESPYAWTKKTNAELVSVYCGWFNIEHAITYFYNVYGEGEISGGKYATVIAKFLALAEKGETSLPVVRPGTQQRNFTHIDDIIDGLVVVALRGSGDGYGIGSDESYSILDLVEMMQKGVDWLPERKGNRMSSPVKTERLKGLGWRCKRSVEQYVQGRLGRGC